MNARRMFRASESEHRDSRKIRGRIGFTYRDRILSQLNGDCRVAFKQALVNNRRCRLIEIIFCGIRVAIEPLRYLMMVLNVLLLYCAEE